MSFQCPFTCPPGRQLIVSTDAPTHLLLPRVLHLRGLRLATYLDTESRSQHRLSTVPQAGFTRHLGDKHYSVVPPPKESIRSRVLDETLTCHSLRVVRGQLLTAPIRLCRCTKLKCTPYADTPQPLLNSEQDATLIPTRLKIGPPAALGNCTPPTCS
jgi:hypothetical protein